MGKPAARIGDMHTCPMVTPGTPPVPHVGGPIVGPGAPTVLIGGVPAAVMGDMCTCVGPPDTIILGSTGVLIGGKPAARMGDQCAHGGAITVGCPTVLIGEASGGGGGGIAVMPVNVLLDVMKTMPAEMQTKMAQVVTMKKAAENGTPFCEKCAAAAMKKALGAKPKPVLAFDVEKAVSALVKNAKSKSVGQCAKYVRKALESGGFNTQGHPVSAKDYKEFLREKGLEEVTLDGYQPKKGDISVVEAIPGGEHGHIAMWDGQQWVSDFKQRTLYPGDGYRQAKPDYVIFRP